MQATLLFRSPGLCPGGALPLFPSGGGHALLGSLGGASLPPPLESGVSIRSPCVSTSCFLVHWRGTSSPALGMSSASKRPPWATTAVWKPPHAMLATAREDRPATARGLIACFSSPCPSLPSLPSPHEYTTPSSATAMVWRLPHAT